MGKKLCKPVRRSCGAAMPVAPPRFAGGKLLGLPAAGRGFGGLGFALSIPKGIPAGASTRNRKPLVSCLSVRSGGAGVRRVYRQAFAPPPCNRLFRPASCPWQSVRPWRHIPPPLSCPLRLLLGQGPLSKPQFCFGWSLVICLSVRLGRCHTHTTWQEN